jgi:hypothetical protein
MDEEGSAPRRRGRPPLSPGAPKRAAFNTRLREALKKQLEIAAAAAGRSLSEEIECRLEQSFQNGGPRTQALLRSLGNQTKLWAGEPDSWLDDPAGYQHLSHGWKITIDNYRPPLSELTLRRIKEGEQAALRLANDDYPTPQQRDRDATLVQFLAENPTIPEGHRLKFHAVAVAYPLIARAAR